MKRIRLGRPVRASATLPSVMSVNEPAIRSLAGRVPHRHPAAEHPAIGLVLVQQPVFALEMRGDPRRWARQLRLDPRDVLGVDPPQPFLRARADLLVLVAEHRLPARESNRPRPSARSQSQSPSLVPRAARAYRASLSRSAAWAPLVRHLGGDPGQDDREVDRLGHVVVGAELERLDDDRRSGPWRSP